MVRSSGSGIALPDRHVFTLERIAARWRVEVDRVTELVYSRQLPQAFVISGPARLLILNASGSVEPHPDPRLPAARARLIVSTFHSMPDPLSWPLSRVRRIYEFAAGDSFGRLSLLQYCIHDDARGLGWSIQFDPIAATLDGNEYALVELNDLLEFERLWQIGPTLEQPRKHSGKVRDTRRQRCRVAAEIIWRNDPQFTLTQVFRHESVQLVACEGKPPTEKIFREWVKDLNPNRKPGRRPRRI